MIEACFLWLLQSHVNVWNGVIISMIKYYGTTMDDLGLDHLQYLTAQLNTRLSCSGLETCLISFLLVFLRSISLILFNVLLSVIVWDSSVIECNQELQVFGIQHGKSEKSCLLVTARNANAERLHLLFLVCENSWVAFLNEPAHISCLHWSALLTAIRNSDSKGDRFIAVSHLKIGAGLHQLTDFSVEFLFFLLQTQHPVHPFHWKKDIQLDSAISKRNKLSSSACLAFLFSWSMNWSINMLVLLKTSPTNAPAPSLFEPDGSVPLSDSTFTNQALHENSMDAE